MAIAIYGDSLGRSYGVHQPPTAISCTPSGHILAATELRCDLPQRPLTDSLGCADAYLVGLQLRGLARQQQWIDGQPQAMQSVGAGAVCFQDLRRNHVASLDEPFHSLHFYVPTAALAETCEANQLERFDGFRFEDGAFIEDATVHRLGLCLLPSLQRTPIGNQLFVDHLFQALLGYLVSGYGGTRHVLSPRTGGLAPWQQRRATELILAHVVEGISLSELAKACRLSASAFARAFKHSTGHAPHEWLVLRRIELATTLLRDPSLSLADVALTAGFSDQSHFTRAFGKRIGISPGAWRSARAARRQVRDGARPVSSVRVRLDAGDIPALAAQSPCLA